jgi:uncharacterized membrane protein YfcA
MGKSFNSEPSDLETVAIDMAIRHGTPGIGSHCRSETPASRRAIMSAFALILLGVIAGAGAGVLAGLLGIGGGIVIVPVIYFGLVHDGTLPNTAAHIAVATSLAAIVPTAIVSFLGHWRAGNTDFGFLRDWGPGIAAGVIVAQLAAPHIRGAVLSGTFGLACVAFAVRFAAPGYFQPLVDRPPGGLFPMASGVVIGAVSGIAGIGGGILTNIVMTVSGMPMHKSIGRAAAAGIVVGVPATIVAALASESLDATAIGSIDLAIWLCIAPAQSAAAWFGAKLASRIGAAALSRLMALNLAATGTAMLYSSLS